jgi:hypothetical protein
MRHWNRALTTLAAAAVAGFLLWFAPHFHRWTTGGYWGVMALIAIAGVLIGLSQLPRPRREPDGQLSRRLPAGARRRRLGDPRRPAARKLDPGSRPLVERRHGDRPRRAQPRRARRGAGLRPRGSSSASRSNRRWSVAARRKRTWPPPPQRQRRARRRSPPILWWRSPRSSSRLLSRPRPASRGPPRRPPDPSGRRELARAPFQPWGVRKPGRLSLRTPRSRVSPRRRRCARRALNGAAAARCARGRWRPLCARRRARTGAAHA